MLIAGKIKQGDHIVVSVDEEGNPVIEVKNENKN
jgi:hypothetical protein